MDGRLQLFSGNAHRTLANAIARELEVPLGNALVEHAGGRLTPAALHAYGQAQRRAPDSAAPGYFLGLAYLRSGEPQRTREVWAELLANAPSDAAWRPAMAERLARLDMLLAASAPR